MAIETTFLRSVRLSNSIGDLMNYMWIVMFTPYNVTVVETPSHPLFLYDGDFSIFRSLKAVGSNY